MKFQIILKAGQGFLFVFFLISILPGQQVLQDTTLNDFKPSLYGIDSVTVDTVQAESRPVPPKSGLDGPIRYWAENISLQNNGNDIILQGQAKMIYQDMTLTAWEIRINREKNTLYARGRADSVDAAGNPVYSSQPIFDEKGQEPMSGDFLEYNFNTRRGKVTMGKTQMDPGYYKGENINKIGEKTLLVRTGYFTSCEDIDDPHYYFKSERMRVKIRDKVIAEPIVFYIADVPLFWLPFGIFPNKRGRHSGIVIPKYGENRVGGRFLRDMGYYWAPNDYFDASLLTTFYDRIGFTYSADLRYTLRYHLNGALSGEYFPRDPSSGQRRERWRVQYRHSQEIDPTFRIAGSGSFVSDKNFSKQLSPNQDDRLNQNLSSNLTINKSWKGTKNSMSASFSRLQNLQTGQTTTTLPNVSFNRAQSSFYETITGKSPGSRRSWYQNIYYSYNSSGSRREDKIPIRNDTTGALTGDFTETTQQGIQHRLEFNAPQTVFRYFNVRPSLSYREDWVDEITVAEYDSAQKKIIESKKKQFAARRTFNSSVGLTTKLYGLFEPNIGSLKFIRHTVDPSISINYTPDFSSPFYGYVTTLRDSAGRPVKIDKFKNAISGGTPSRKSQSMNISLRNFFEGKLIDEDGKEKKFDILTVNMSTSYNMLADSLKWSNLSARFSTKIMGKNIEVRSTYSFYKPRSDGKGNRDSFAPFPRLLDLSTSLGFAINHKTFQKKDEKKGRDREDATDTRTADEDREGILTSQGIQFEKRDYLEETKAIEIPWSTSFNINYSLSRADVNKPVQRIDMSARANFQLTKNWKVSWNARFDLEKKDMTSSSFSIYRDLHCWEMSFDWQPLFGYYSFQINVKASALQDIKITKHPTRSTYIPRY